MSPAPALRVVIPTHQRRESLLRTLNALGAQTAPPDEVVVVADGCTDGTAEAARAARWPFALAVVEQPASGAAAARNAGAARAGDGLLLFLDDDVEASPGLVAAHLCAHREGRGEVVLGPALPELGARNDLFAQGLRAWWHEAFAAMARPGHRFTFRDLLTGNLSLPAALFVRAGGFDAALHCREDYELGARLLAAGARFAFAAEAIGRHRDATDLDRSLVRARQEGRGDVAIARRHPDLLPALDLARPLAPRERRLAFEHPGWGDLLAGRARALLDRLESARLRRRWRGLYGKLRRYWYLRGLADESESPTALCDLLAACRRAARDELPELDLGDGLDALELRLDRERPRGVRLRYRRQPIGAIPAEPGAEPLRGAHLRPALAGELAEPLAAALAIEAALSGEPAGAGPFALAEPPAEERISELCRRAGELLGKGEDPLRPLDGLGLSPTVDPAECATRLLGTLPPALRAAPDPLALLEPRLSGFLLALEARTGNPGLARRARAALERRALDAMPPAGPRRIGATWGLAVEATRPFADLVPPAGVERLHARVLLEGSELGTIELPVCDGRVRGDVLADAVAARFAWPLLGRFFARTLRERIEVREGEEGLGAWRGEVRLAAGLEPEEAADPARLYDRTGWTLFLQELWGLPEWTGDDFYDASRGAGPAAAMVRPAGGWIAVEAAGELPEVETDGETVAAELSVGGVPIGAVELAAERGRITAQGLRAALTAAAGFELCVAAVREGVLGLPLAAPGTLRERLAARAVPREESARESAPSDHSPGWRRALARASDGPDALVLGRRGGPIAVAARRASLPAAAAPYLVAAAAADGRPALRAGGGEGSPARVVYAPDLLARPAGPGLHFARELRTELYRIQLFRRVEGRESSAGARGPEVVEHAEHAPPRPEVAATFRHPGGGVPAASPRAEAGRLPILMYHRIAPDGPAALARWRVTPEAFAEQLRYLAEAGFTSVTLERWREAVAAQRPLPGRAVLLTFDDGYRDFATHAWPALRRHRFGALVFLVADRIGGTSEWDAPWGGAAPLLDWDEVRRLRHEGVEIGSHSATHRPLTGLSPAEVAVEAARSRELLERGLGRPVAAFAYPYGDLDPAVEHLVGACGYTFGLSVRPGSCDPRDPLLALPRIEVRGDAGLEAFIAGLPA